MNYRQLKIEERSALAVLRLQGLGVAAVAAVLLRHRTTIWREIKRNSTPHDGRYRVQRAHERAVARRRRSRRNKHFEPAQMTQKNKGTGLLKEMA